MKAAADPILTVALATYNRADFLVASVERVLQQDFERFELVVVDDGSTDETERVARSIRDSRVRYVRRARNGGISAARNTGAEHARSPYIVFLDDDDLPRAGWLSVFAREIESGPAVVSCGARLVTNSGNLLRIRLPSPGDDDPLFLAGTFCVRLDLFHEAGGYLEGLQCSHQTELALRLLPLCRSEGLPVVSIEKPLIDIVRREPGERPESSPGKLLSGALEVLRLHGHTFQPADHGRYLAIAGVSAARLGDFVQARRLFVRALTVDPWEWRHAGRLMAATIPPAGRRLWGNIGT